MPQNGKETVKFFALSGGDLIYSLLSAGITCSIMCHYVSLDHRICPNFTHSEVPLECRASLGMGSPGARPQTPDPPLSSCAIMSLDREFLPQTGKETVKFSASLDIPMERRASLGTGLPQSTFRTPFNPSTSHLSCQGFVETTPGTNRESVQKECRNGAILNRQCWGARGLVSEIFCNSCHTVPSSGA
jgi:hypothetical protein